MKLIGNKINQLTKLIDSKMEHLSFSAAVGIFFPIPLAINFTSDSLSLALQSVSRGNHTLTLTLKFKDST